VEMAAMAVLAATAVLVVLADWAVKVDRAERVVPAARAFGLQLLSQSITPARSLAVQLAPTVR
jgi:hypothetical protein